MICKFEECDRKGQYIVDTGTGIDSQVHTEVFYCLYHARRIATTLYAMFSDLAEISIYRVERISRRTK